MSGPTQAEDEQRSARHEHDAMSKRHRHASVARGCSVRIVGMLAVQRRASNLAASDAVSLGTGSHTHRGSSSWLVGAQEALARKFRR